MTPPEEKQLLDDVSEIKRGLFGEEKLEQPGLVHDVKTLKEWRESIKMKLAYVAGVTAAFAFIFERAWQWFIEKKQ